MREPGARTWADLDRLSADRAPLPVLDLLRVLLQWLARRLALGRVHSDRAVATGAVLLFHCLVIVAAAVALECIAVSSAVGHFRERVDCAAACEAPEA